MKNLLFVVILILLAIGLPFSSTQGQQQAEPQNKLIEFQMALLKRGPKWSPHPGKDSTTIHDQHVAYVHSLLESGKAMIAGSIKDDPELVAVYIFRTKSAEEAKSWVIADPAVSGGHVVAELHPWWTEDVMKKTTTPQKLTTAYLAFLKRGEKWTPEKSPATAEIQKGHMANIQRLAEMKKLVVAGPFGDEGQLRGIFVFRVDSLEEARALAATDPAVQAGRLALDIHAWIVPEGILP